MLALDVLESGARTPNTGAVQLPWCLRHAASIASTHTHRLQRLGAVACARSEHPIQTAQDAGAAVRRDATKMMQDDTQDAAATMRAAALNATAQQGPAALETAHGYRRADDG